MSNHHSIVTDAPDTAGPDTATPDTATPDTATPDTATPDPATPDTAMPGDVGTPTAASPRLDGLDDDSSADDLDGGDLEPERPPLIAPDGRVRLSFSRIDTFDLCSLQFRYRYVDRLPTKPATYLSFGTSVHAALELFHDRTLFGRPSLDDLLQFLYDHWDSSGYAHVPRDRQLTDYQRARHCLTRYWHRVGDAYEPAADTEKWFELPVGDNALVVGSIDRVDVDVHGDLHVVDYKTGKLRDRERVRKSLQLSIYALACEHLYGRLPASVALDYVVADMSVRVPVAELDLDGARRAITQTADAVLAQRYEPTPNPLCDWCDFQSACPAWEGDGQEVLGPAVVERDRLRRSVRRDLDRLRSLEAAVDRLSDELDTRGLDPVLDAADVAAPDQPPPGGMAGGRR